MILTTRLQKWTPTGWKSESLSALGHIHNLGHDCRLCPAATIEPLTVIAIDSTGIQLVKVSICECPPKEDLYQQLVRNRWIPSSITRPKVICSFQCREQFRSLEYHGVSAVSFYTSLKLLSSSSGLPQMEVSNCVICRPAMTDKSNRMWWMSLLPPVMSLMP